MTALATQLTGSTTMLERSDRDLVPELHRSLASVEPVWRALEAEAAPFATPYQRFDWVRAFVETELGTEPQAQAGRLRVIVLRDVRGRARTILPLTVSRAHGVSTARVVGAKHANFHMPFFACAEAAALVPESLTAALVAAGRAGGIDLFLLDHQPRVFDGMPNPLSAGGHPCPSDAYGMRLGPDAEATLKRAFSGDARKKLRAKERKLVEAHGPVLHRVATTQEMVDTILDAFFAQKAARFAAMGILDPYADPAARRFVQAATRIAPGRVPAIEVHALVAEASGRVFATFGGAVDARRFSGIWTSFDPDPEIGRSSPGDLLLSKLIGQQTEAGRHAFDLGVGEARYKANTCDETIELVERIIPVTLAGRAHAWIALGRLEARRRIKRSPRLLAAVQRLRRLRTR